GGRGPRHRRLQDGRHRRLPGPVPGRAPRAPAPAVRTRPRPGPGPSRARAARALHRARPGRAGVTVFHLVRHGQVDNPHKVVYGRQRGWRLSARGHKEAEAVARHLAGRPIARVYTSPLERALQTATVIAGACASEVELREDLGEAFLCAQWEGLSWRDVRHGRAADWARYLFRPLDIEGVPEDLRALAER